MQRQPHRPRVIAISRQTPASRLFPGLLAASALVLLLLQTAAMAAVKVGEPAPEFSGIDSHGKTHELSDYRGRYVILEWTNHDCPYVRKHYDSGNMQTQQLTAEITGFVWLSIISSAPGKQGHVTAEQANALTASRDARPSAVILDPSGAIGRAYKAKTTPHMFIIDPRGKLIYQGGIDSIRSANPADIAKAKQYVQSAMRQIKTGQPLSDAVTQPYGCSVKY